uniref:Uncharacterized protein n=1 Tax=Aotus nancymaae TaxID=37293 RepID=A0A2K5C3Z8_AOTNA
MNQKLLCPSHGCQTLVPPHWVLPCGPHPIDQEPRREGRAACGGTVSPLCFKGSWRLLTLSSFASRDSIFTG